MPSEPHKQRRSNVTQAYIEEYCLEDLEKVSQQLMKKHGIEARHMQTAFQTLFETPLATPEIPRLKNLKKESSYDPDFLGTKRFNMSIIDLHTENTPDLKSIARYSERSLVRMGWHGELEWVIHIFCSRIYGSENHTFTPITMSILLLHHILVQLRERPFAKNKDWGSINVEHKPTEKEGLPYQQYIMEILTQLVDRILEKCPQLFVHFVFSGIVLDRHYKNWFYPLARFMVDMARLVGYVDPIGENRMVKCIFSGCGLLDEAYLFRFLRLERMKKSESSRRKAEIEDIFVQTLMLDWDRDQSCYRNVELIEEETDSGGKEPASLQDLGS